MYVAVRVLLGVLIAGYLSVSGYRRQRLSLDGAVAAFIVGAGIFTAGYIYGVTLIVFYYTSSKLTKYKEREKQSFEEHYKLGGQRDIVQVLVNSLNALILAVLGLTLSPRCLGLLTCQTPPLSFCSWADFGGWLCHGSPE